MEGSCRCQKCHSRSLAADDVTGNMVCVSCGVVQEFHNFQADFGGISGPKGTFVRIGTVGSGSFLNYKEKKIFHAQKLIENDMVRLGLSDEKTHEVKLLVEKITDGEYGEGMWFPIFVGACAYVVMRKDQNMLPIVEVADVVGCDASELGRMVSRVTKFTGLKLPEFDIVDSFERAIKVCPSFNGISDDTVQRMLQQGVFLVQCLVKWFITTGRRPQPVVVAVLVLVAGLNEVDIKIEDLAAELHAAVSTCRRRYKELLESLVKVAQVLPWGKDVSVKNIQKNAPFVLQYMEKKSRATCDGEGQGTELVPWDLENLVGDCLSKDTRYGVENHASDDSVFRYFEEDKVLNPVSDHPDIYKFSSESLSMVYAKFLDEMSGVKTATEIDEKRAFKRRKSFNILECWDWWEGKSDLSKKLYLKQILERDVGLDTNPPSFDSGCLARQERIAKIEAAKERLRRTLNPSSVASSSDKPKNSKRRRNQIHTDVDWEDLIIETLLLHSVREEDIVDGQYSVLLDLHVFN